MHQLWGSRLVYQTDFSISLNKHLIVRDCDDGFLVFNTNKGTTSLVANSGVELIQALGLSEVLSHQQALSILGCERDDFGAIISSMEKSGIIVRC